MKYVQRTKENIKEDFLKNLLLDRETIKNDADFQRKFFMPTENNLLDPIDLENMDKGFQVFKSHLEQGNRIYIIQDPDMDGVASAAILYNYMNDYLKPIYPNFTIDYHIPTGKAHGLETIIDLFLPEKKYDLIILPDAGSNDIDQHAILKEIGYDIICLDHHLISYEAHDAIVINNQASPRYENKHLSGVGVVYKFLQYCDKQFNINKANEYLDLVAAAQIGDMMNVNTLENRYITSYGLSHIRNQGLIELIRNQAYSLFKMKPEEITDDFIVKITLTPIQVAFYIAPLINALIRVGSPNEKLLLFKAFIEGQSVIPSTKRGHKGEFETIAVQNARNCVNARTRQNKEKEKALELLDIQISNNCLDDNKILILNADELDVSNTLTGLCAMGVAAKYKKPVILGRTSPDGFLKGSMRGVNGSELKDFKDFLLSSNLMDYVEGHANAAGASLKVYNVDKLLDYANHKLANINFNEGFYEADFIVNGNCSYLDDLIKDLWCGRAIYGQECPEPTIVVKNMTLDASDIQVIGSNKDTLKFVFNGITYLKFKAQKLIDEFNSYNGKICLTIVGKANVNEWCGRTTSQIFLDDVEINTIDINAF